MTTNIYPVGSEEDDIERVDRYIRNPFKTLVDHEDMETIETLLIDEENRSVTGQFVCDITASEDGTAKVYLSGAYLCTPEGFYQTCTRLKKFYLKWHRRKKDDGEMCAHIVLSWPEDADISYEDVYKATQDLIRELGNFPAIFSVHLRPAYKRIDGKEVLTGIQPHAHILMCRYPAVFDAVPYKLDFGPGKCLLREKSDEIAIKYKQKIIVEADYRRKRSYYEAKLVKFGGSWKERIRITAEKAFNLTQNFKDFVAHMKKDGVVVFEEENSLWYQVEDCERPVQDKTLGHDYTKKAMEERWTNGPWYYVGKRALKKLETDHGKLYVRIYLGGRERKNQKFKLFELTEGCLDYSSDVLRTYFIVGKKYRIYNTKGECIKEEVDGGEILDYLGVFPRRANAQELQRLGITGLEAEYKRRIKRELEIDCNLNSTEWIIRNRRIIDQKKHARKPIHQKKRYDYRRDYNGNKLPALTLFILLLLDICVPRFDINEFVYCYNPDEPNRMEWDILEEAPIYEPAQRIYDSYRVMVEEGFKTDIELIEASIFADREYDRLATQLARLLAELERGDVVECVGNVVTELYPKFTELLQENLTWSELKKRDPKSCTEYENAVEQLRDFSITHMEALLWYCESRKTLQEFRPILLQVVSDAFTYKRKLELAVEYRGLLGQKLFREDDIPKEEVYDSVKGLVERMAAPEKELSQVQQDSIQERDMNPPLDAIIGGAQERTSPPQKRKIDPGRDIEGR